MKRAQLSFSSRTLVGDLLIPRPVMTTVAAELNDGVPEVKSQEMITSRSLVNVKGRLAARRLFDVLHYPQSFSVTDLIGEAHCYHGNVSNNIPVS